jgi:hypothetical protein
MIHAFVRLCKPVYPFGNSVIGFIPLRKDKRHTYAWTLVRGLVWNLARDWDSELDSGVHELCSLSSGMLADTADIPPVLLAVFYSCVTA